MKMVAEDPDEWEEANIPKVLMLGEKEAVKRSHPGKYDIVELFSPPRVVDVANSMG